MGKLETTYQKKLADGDIAADGAQAEAGGYGHAPIGVARRDPAAMWSGECGWWIFMGEADGAGLGRS